MTSHSTALCSALTCVAAAAATPLAAQTPTQPEIVACFDSRTSSSGVPVGSGIVYRINAPGVVGQGGCVDPRHIQFSWTIRHSALTGLSNDDHPQYLLANGTRALTGPLQAGSFKITGLAAGTAAGDAVRFDQVVKTGDVAGGDLSGTYPNPSVVQLQGRAVTNAAPSSGQVLSWTGTAWAPATPSSGASGVAGGDLTGLYPNPSIALGAVGTTKLADASVTNAKLVNSTITLQTGVGLTGGGTVALGGSGLTLSLAPGSGFGQVLSWTGSLWAPQTISIGQLPSPLSTFGFINAPNTLVLRDPIGGFVAGPVKLEGTLTLNPTSGNALLTTGGNVGIGTSTPASKLTVAGTIESASGGFRFPDGTVQISAAAGGASGTPNNTANTLVQRDANGGFAAGPVTLDGGFLVRGVSGSAIPAAGSGERLMYHAGKDAFRAGRVLGDQWDDANVGVASAAMGLNTIASGDRSTATGLSTRASGFESTAMGSGTAASGQASTAMGSGTVASGTASTAMGDHTTAIGLRSTAMGRSTSASGFDATAMGSGTIASGVGSTAMGAGTNASGFDATAMGSGTTASGGTSTAMGDRTTASGQGSIAMGTCATAIGNGSTAMGFNATALGEGSFVYGDVPPPNVGCGQNPVTDGDKNQFVVRATGGTIFYSNFVLTAGVLLAPGAGAWASVSDIRRKENFREVDGERVLRKIAQLPVREWNYKAQDASIRHLGPTAQDFWAAFRLGESDTTITTTDIDGVNLLAVQALERRTREQAREIEALRSELAALRAEIAQRKQQLPTRSPR